ncbi:hypothetical protein [Frankia sp. R43]|uniref:hypothetical protein n=1 Tax=Frankia sp. R43 TaxID=269536 RepID=UPI0006CA07A1|nr:hypothetical protein [Frankia sp. R43]
MRADNARRGWTRLGRGLATALARRSETPYARAQRRRERVRDTFLTARDEWRLLLEILIEGETRAVCPAATELEVETYTDELGEPRGRLISILTDEGSADKDEEAVTERISELLDEWSIVTDPDTTEIAFTLAVDVHGSTSDDRS